MSGTIGGASATGVGNVWKRAKGYANGGYVADDKQKEEIKQWNAMRKAQREKGGDMATFDSAMTSSYAGQGALTKEQGEQQKKAFQAKLTEEKTLFGSTAASRGLDTLGSAFSTLSHGVIGAGQGVIGGGLSLVGAGDEYLRESGARLRAAGQHAQNVARLGGRFNKVLSQDAFEQFRGDRVEDEGQKWAYGASQFMAEMAPVGAVAKGVGLAAKGASYVGKLGKGARAAVKAKAGAKAATKAKGAAKPRSDVLAKLRGRERAAANRVAAKPAAKSNPAFRTPQELFAVAEKGAKTAKPTLKAAKPTVTKKSVHDVDSLTKGLMPSSAAEVNDLIKGIPTASVSKQQKIAANLKQQVSLDKAMTRAKAPRTAGTEAVQIPAEIARATIGKLPSLTAKPAKKISAIDRMVATTQEAQRARLNEVMKASKATTKRSRAGTQKVQAPSALQRKTPADTSKLSAARDTAIERTKTARKSSKAAPKGTKLKKSPTKATPSGALTHVPGESKSVAETLYGASHWTSAKASFGMGSLSKLLDPAVMLATRGLQYLQKGKGKGEAGLEPSKAGGAAKAAVKPLKMETDLPPTSKPSAVKPLKMETDLPPTSKPDAKTGPKTPSLRHQRAFMRRQARKRRLGIATDFDTARGSGAFRPGVQGRLKESGLWDWARLGRGAGAQPGGWEGIPFTGGPAWQGGGSGGAAPAFGTPARGAQPTGAPAKAKAKRKTGGRRQATMDRNRFRALERQMYEGKPLSPADQHFYDSHKKTKDTKRAAYRKGSGGYGARQRELKDQKIAGAEARVAAVPGYDPRQFGVVNKLADMARTQTARDLGRTRAKYGKQKPKSEDEKAFWAAIGEGRRGVRDEEKDRRVARFRRARGYSEGGSVPGAAPAAPAAVFASRGTDTVPAMLTPGEFVINKSSAQSIGYNRLNSMNRMAQGGVVQPQYLSNGGTSSSAYSTNGGDVAAQLADSQASMNKLADALGKIPQSIDLNLQGDSRVIIDFGADMVPQVKKYFQEWYQEALKGPQGTRLDGSSPDPSMMNTV